MIKSRYFNFFPEHWKGDVALRLCSLGARGLWMEMLCEMHSADPYGHLVTSTGVAIEVPGELAQMLGQKAVDVRRWIAELERAQVFSRTKDGVIYSRRMVRDEVLREDWRERQSHSRKGRSAPRNGAAGHADVTPDVTSMSPPMSRERHALYQNQNQNIDPPLTPQGEVLRLNTLGEEVDAMREIELRDLTPEQRTALSRYHVATFGAPDEPESSRQRRAARLALTFAKMGLTPDLGDLLVDEYLIAAARFFADRGGSPWFRPFEIRAVLPAEILTRTNGSAR